MSRWEEFRTFWWGLCGGTLMGIAIGVGIADKPGWKWFAGTAGSLIILVAMLPDLLTRIVRDLRRYRTAARR